MNKTQCEKSPTWRAFKKAQAKLATLKAKPNTSPDTLAAAKREHVDCARKVLEAVGGLPQRPRRPQS
jgi:alpha-beta hydrolase superfamily lysophospholipase